MRTLFLFTFCLVGFVSNAQVVVDSANHKIYVDRVQEVVLKKHELKDRANRWVAKTYNNSNYVTRINNEDNILTKGAFQVGADFTTMGTTVYLPRTVEYTLDLKFKDGRYKIEISDLLFDGSDASTSLEVYFMTLEEYREFMLQTMEAYDGPGKKAVMKRINNDRAFKKDYEAQQNYGRKIIPQIVKKLEQIDLSLLNSLKNTGDDDDW